MSNHDEAALTRDLGYLREHDALAGITAIVSARAQRVRGGFDGGYAKASHLAAAARAEVDGPHPDPAAYAQGGALLAAAIDRDASR